MSELARQTVDTIVTRLVVLVLGAVTGLVLARALLPEGRGQYAALVALAGTALAFGHLSVGQAQAALWAPGQVAAFTANSVPLGLLAGAFAAALTGLGVWVLGPEVVPVPNGGLLVLALGATPVAMAVLYLSGTLVLSNGLPAVNRAELVVALVQCTPLLLLGLVHHLSVPAVMLIWLLAQVVHLAVLLNVTRPERAWFDPYLARRAVTVGLRHHCGFVALFLLQRIDILVLNALRLPADVGRYAVAVMLIELARLPADALAQAVTHRQASDDLTSAGEVTARAVRVSALLGAGCGLALCAVVPWLVPIAYGAPFGGAVPAVFALAPGLVARAATRPIGQYLLRLERPWLSVVPPSVALAAALTVHFALIPRWGVVGCGLACSTGFLCLAAIQIAMYLHASGQPPRRLLPTGADLRSAVSAVRRRGRPRARAALQDTPRTTP